MSQHKNIHTCPCWVPAEQTFSLHKQDFHSFPRSEGKNEKYTIILSLAPRGRMKNTLSFSPSLRGKEWQCIFHSSPRSEGRNEIFETLLGNLWNIFLKNDIVFSSSSGKYIAWGKDVKIKFCIKQFQRFSFEESCKSYILQRFSRQCFIDF